MEQYRIEDAIGVVLAGGRSTRFGRDKALEPVRGVPMAEHVYHTVRSVIRDTFVGVSRSEDRSRLPHAEPLFDDPPDVGPAGALRAALLASRGRWVFLAACDLPGLTPEAVRSVLDARGAASSAVVPVDAHGRAHPLVAAWHPDVLPVLEMRLREGRRSLRGLLEHVPWRSVAVPEAALLNVNRPDDLPA